ncbi:MAG: sulfotransferase family 2 domain-containing protein, partial [Caldilineaceae bacterium]|nr:sulfotransferase family 2 domain-containing protein [Caldilineaceae bacterium]
SGHMAFGVHQWLPQPYSYITLLREPVERIISYYYFILHYPGHYLYETIAGQQMSLHDVVTSGISREFDNLQTRLLSGMPKVDYGQCSAAMLTAANDNLATHFRLVGTTKKFDEFLVLVSQAYGWRSPFYVKKHVTKNRPRRQEIARETLRAIEQYHALDLALYERVEQNFAQLIDEQGEAFQREVKRFQWLNSAYTFSYPVLHKIRRVQERLAA